jgi:hypothetical protein
MPQEKVMQRSLAHPFVSRSANLAEPLRLAGRGLIGLALVWVVVYGLLVPAIEVAYRVTGLAA